MYEFEKNLPKSEAHNIQRIEEKLRQAWLTDPYRRVRWHRISGPPAHASSRERVSARFKRRRYKGYTGLHGA
jgi:hypothetical protein